MTDNTMAKGQHDKQWETMQWLKDNRTNNDRQYNDQKKDRQYNDQKKDRQ